jgi:PTH1 family peptidyl-tRNA hydrolase
MDPPRRLLFIASIGNKAPYRKTRHSAGHLLLDAVKPLLQRTHPNTGTFHETWYSPTYMNESGPKLVRQMEKWAQRQNETCMKIYPPPPPSLSSPSSSASYPTTLIILHDELESPLGKLRVKRGGPEAASLRGHRGLISICETLRGKGLHPVRNKEGAFADFSILRVGVGIGRPPSREKGAVSEYVLAPVSEGEMRAYAGAAEGVVKVIGEEMYRV